MKLKSAFLLANCILTLPYLDSFESSRSACFGQQPTVANRSTIAWPTNLPVFDHIVIVVEENKDYVDIIGKPEAPYINSLKAEGASFTRMFGEEHNSQGNYYWMFSGSNQAVGFNDVVPNEQNHPGYPFTASNLGCQLIKKGLSFKAFSQSLPCIGFMGEKSPDHRYARKHAPWTSFTNVPNGTTRETSSHLPFDDFPKDPAGFSALPTVAFVVPDLMYDMHDGLPEHSIPRGDKWLRQNIDAYYQWAKSNNSLLIVTFDENDDKKMYQGLTDPFVVPKDENDEMGIDLQNRIATIFAGAHIQAGEYPEGPGITHVNILRTIEAMYGLPKSGAQQPKAAAGGITDDAIITDVFKPVK